MPLSFLKILREMPSITKTRPKNGYELLVIFVRRTINVRDRRTAALRNTRKETDHMTISKQSRPGGSSPRPSSAIPSAQVLVYQPDLTHSVWTDVMHRKRSQKSLEAMLRKGVRSGDYVGYRLLTIHAEYLGISWPNDQGDR